MEQYTKHQIAANTTVAITAVCFFHCITVNPSSFFPIYYYLIPFGLTFLGYHFIRKFDQKVSHETSLAENVMLLISVICIIPLLYHLPLDPIKWAFALSTLVISILYIVPKTHWKLRAHWWSKSIAITYVWITLFGVILSPLTMKEISLLNPILLLQLILTMLLSCWVYDIHESDWSEEKIRNVKILAISTLSFVGLLSLTMAQKKGTIIIPLVLFALHITRLKKDYHPQQNVWIDIYLAFIFLSLSL